MIPKMTASLLALSLFACGRGADKNQASLFDLGTKAGGSRFLTLCERPPVTEEGKTIEALRVASGESDCQRAYESLHSMSSLSLAASGITELAPLAEFAQLRHLILEGNVIDDISPLAGLQQLESLNLADNEIDDLKPLAKLSQLSVLDLSENEVRSVADLAGLSQLRSLALSNNQVRDLRPLAQLTSLYHLNRFKIDGNPIERSGCPLLGESHAVVSYCLGAFVGERM